MLININLNPEELDIKELLNQSPFSRNALPHYNSLVEKGARFVIYHYNMGAIFISFKQNSTLKLVNGKRTRFFKGLPYSLITFLFGWWSFPYGPFATFSSLFINFSGGIDLTIEVLEELENQNNPINQYF